MPLSQSEDYRADTTQGDFEAIAYQAFSITRDTKQPVTHDAAGISSDPLRIAEAELRHGRHLVTQDASRPWLWYFKPTTVDAGSQDAIELPVVEGYVLHRMYSACHSQRVLIMSRRTSWLHEGN